MIATSIPCWNPDPWHRCPYPRIDALSLNPSCNDIDAIPIASMPSSLLGTIRLPFASDQHRFHSLFCLCQPFFETPSLFPHRLFTASSQNVHFLLICSHIFRLIFCVPHYSCLSNHQNPSIFSISISIALHRIHFALNFLSKNPHHFSIFLSLSCIVCVCCCVFAGFEFELVSL